MITLLYAVTHAGQVSPRLVGVRQKPVEARAVGDLAIAFSAFDQMEQLPVPESALEFHRVLSTMLRRSDVIPFRFPTWLSVEALEQHLSDRSEAYQHALARIAGCLQMEIRLSGAESPGKRAAIAGVETAPASGREYLQRKSGAQSELRIHAEVARENLDEHVREWRMHLSPEGCRLFALVPRDEVEKFTHKAKALHFADLEVKVTGPWAAFEFITIPGEDEAA
jgi:hypothetical protein